MRKLIYSMGVSLDGFIAGPDGRFGWAAPSEELHRFHNEQARGTGLSLYGRHLYETMKVWETLDQEPGATDVIAEFAEIWRAMPKLVFSRTLAAVEGSNTTLAGRDPVREAARLKEEPGGEISVGGAGLATGLAQAGLIDEYRLFANPVIVGGGTPFFPALEAQIDLELVETRSFSEVVYLRYAR